MTKSKLHILRSVRYIIRMAVLIGIIFLALHFTGTLDTGGESFARALFLSWRGGVLILALVLLAALYPISNFTKAEIRANMTTDREAIMNAMHSCNYVLTSEDKGTLVFRARGKMTRIVSSCNDAVTITDEGDYIGVEGMKKNVSRIGLRARTFLAK